MVTRALPAGLGGQGEGTARDATGKEKAVLQRLKEAISTGLASNLMQRVPHLVLLSDAFYNQTLRPILADWLLLWLRKQARRGDSKAAVPRVAGPCVVVRMWVVEWR